LISDASEYAAEGVVVAIMEGVNDSKFMNNLKLKILSFNK